MPLSCTKANLPLWYKWIVLCAACISTFCSFGYIIGTTSIATVYYVDRYNETLVSSLIGPAQIGFMQILSLPSLFMGRIVGNMALHLIGALVFSGGIALTSLSYLSWQGFLLSGLMAGFGGAMMQVATTQMIKVYFPGRQFAPFGFVCITLNAAAMAYPEMMKFFMSTLEWAYGHVAIASVLLVNLLCGLSYFEPKEEIIGGDNQSLSVSSPKIRLLLPPKPEAASSCVAVVHSQEANEQVHEMFLSADSKLLDTDGEGLADEKLDMEVESGTQTNTALVDRQGMVELLKMPQSLALLFMTFLYSGGLTAVASIMSYYAEVTFHMTKDEIAFSLTMMGLSQIVASVGYLFLTACTEFSATLLHCVCMFILAICCLLISFINSSVQFTIVISVMGFAKAITSGNSVPVSTELSKPDLVMDLYALKFLADGLGSGGVPYLAAFLRDSYSALASFYFSTAALTVSASLFLPFIGRYIRARPDRSSG